MRIPIIPASRFGRAVYLTFVVLCMLSALATAWGQHKKNKALADHGSVADVLPIDHYTQHASTSRIDDTKFNEWKSVQVRFRTESGELVSLSHGVDEQEFETIRSGGTLHVEYLPENPQGSARLAGHRDQPWQMGLVLAFLALYAWVLATPERKFVDEPRRRR